MKWHAIPVLALGIFLANLGYTESRSGLETMRAEVVEVFADGFLTQDNTRVYLPAEMVKHNLGVISVGDQLGLVGTYGDRQSFYAEVVIFPPRPRPIEYRQAPLQSYSDEMTSAY